jgi:urease accessory protein
MVDAAARLALLQHGDSFFPSGTVSFSWGLETLCAEGRVSGADTVADFLVSQLRHRWARYDRGALAAAFLAAADLGAVGEIDRLLDAQTLVAELRSGSCRTGGALLAVHKKLGTPRAEAYLALVRSGAVPGHAAAVQGLVWRGIGLDLGAAEVLSAYTLAVGLLGAALRLGAIGHIDAQRLLQRACGEIADLLIPAAPDIQAIQAFTPESEIAVMRHETADARLFAN